MYKNNINQILVLIFCLKEDRTNPQNNHQSLKQLLVTKKFNLCRVDSCIPCICITESSWVLVEHFTTYCIWFLIAVVLQLEFRHNIHTHELLKQKLARVGDVDVWDVRAGLTPMTPLTIRYPATLIAHVYFELITRHHETFDEEHTGAVTDETVALHLPQPESSLPASPCKHTHRADLL